MLAYPSTQARAHAELDAVVGRSRLPTFADLSHLPYIRAMVKETLRWRPVAPSGVPHRATEDDWYDGMYIHKDTFCIPNVWHLNRDPDMFGKNTDDFDPAQYLDASGDKGRMHPSSPRSRSTGISGTGLAKESASAATWRTTSFSSILRSCYGQ
jgi:cytochrome P450